MKIKYSKKSSDINKEYNLSLKMDRELFEKQKTISNKLLKYRKRKKCILCANKLKGEQFQHRNIHFVVCEVCGHIQTMKIPPSDYPNIEMKTIYPNLNKTDYIDRKTRIYEPKLKWIIDCLNDMGYTLKQIKELKWFEMGVGAGYFLYSLKEMGILKIKGIDSDEGMVSISNSFLEKNNIVDLYKKNLSTSLCDFKADIYISFFVLEHISDVYEFFSNLAFLPSGTIFIFSVPLFGFSCLLEGVFENNFARNLDCIVHTQLFTDNSIEYAMKIADFEIKFQWIFGEDSLDLTRFLLTNIKDKYSKKVFSKIHENLEKLQDPLQHCLDKLKLSDQRHIIAVKK